MPDPGARAAEMAVAMREAMVGVSASWRCRGHQRDFAGGIAIGYATLGTIGFEGCYDYGAVGSVMKLASRLCDEAGPGQILINARALDAAGERIVAEPVGELALKGFARPVAAFDVVSVAPATTPAG